MTTSGTVAWNPSVALICNQALLQVGAIQQGETASADDYPNLVFMLNAMIKEWQATGLHVWTEEEGILFLQVGQYRYLLGGATTDHAADAWNWTGSLLAASAIAGDLTVTAASSVVNVTDHDPVGIVLDGGSIFWTTANGNPVLQVITLTDPLPGHATAGARVFSYRTSVTVSRPLKITSARAYRFDTGIETPLNILSRQQYFGRPGRSPGGVPTEFFYSPKLVSGEFYLNNIPDDADWGVRFTWNRSIQDFILTADTADLPQEWVSCLTWNLAREIMVPYEVPPGRADLILKTAMAKFEMVESWDRESEPIRFRADLRGWR